MYAGGPVALLTLLPLCKMSPRYLELKRLFVFFAAPGELVGICSNQRKAQLNQRSLQIQLNNINLLRFSEIFIRFLDRFLWNIKSSIYFFFLSIAVVASRWFRRRCLAKTIRARCNLLFLSIKPCMILLLRRGGTTTASHR